MPKSLERRAKVLTVLNLKGGVGKTHVAWLLGSVCHEQGKRVLLIDTDPQGNLSNSFVRSGSRVPGVERLLDPSCDTDLAAVIRRTAYSSIDIVPASAAVSPFDLADQRSWEKAELQHSFVDAIAAAKPLYDFVVFDCPPRLSLASFAALVASDAVVVPLEAADWGAQGVVQVAEAIEYVRGRFNPDLRLLGYLVSRFKAGRLYQQTYLAELRKHFGTLVFDSVVPDLAGFERAVTDAIPITEHDPRGRAANLARKFFDEVLSRLAKKQPTGNRRLSADHRRPAGIAA